MSTIPPDVSPPAPAPAKRRHTREDKIYYAFLVVLIALMAVMYAAPHDSTVSTWASNACAAAIALFFIIHLVPPIRRFVGIRPRRRPDERELLIMSDASALAMRVFSIAMLVAIIVARLREQEIYGYVVVYALTEGTRMIREWWLHRHV